MTYQGNNRTLYTAFIFIFILFIFLFSAYIEYERSATEINQELQNKIQLVSAEVNKFVNQSIRNADGIVAFIQMNPDLTQEDFSMYSSQLLKEDDDIISHFVAIKDTTIVFAYPLEGNEGAIGTDLSKVEGQKDDILQIKEEGISMFVGPVVLVQGGKRLINRMPIILTDDTYWGQLSLVIRYEEMLEAAGVYEYSKTHFIAIEQDITVGNEKKIIYSNYELDKEDGVEMQINVPNGSWTIRTNNKKEKTKTLIFYLLITIGLLFATVISYAVSYMLKSNEALNLIVEERTTDILKSNMELEESLDKLKTTQDQLIMREKHAALGELVASVAHEINTPIGVCITVNSYIDSITAHVIENLEKGTLKKSELQSSFEKINESSSILNDNLDRASQLVSSFKNLATDQFLDEYKSINLKEYFNYILKTISPTYKNTDHKINVHIEDNLLLKTYPGAIFQVITNLIMNSLIHGFEKIDQGVIDIYAKIEENQVVIDYKDNGIGIDPSMKEKIFDPFFTTKRDKGSTGLGMHIIYNIIYQKLEGTIKIIEPIERGVHFNLTIPMKEK